MDIWTKTSGTWLNVATVILGTGLGVVIQGTMPLALQQVITQVIGLMTVFIGINMADSLTKVTIGSVDGTVFGLISLVLGGVWGEWAQLDQQLTTWGDRLRQVIRGGRHFTEGFITASLLFCIGPMALLGSINNGLMGDAKLLTLKATLDGIAAIALTSSFGIGVGFSALVLLLYQGTLSLAAGSLAQALPNPATAPPVLLLTGVGGIMVLGIGFNLLGVASIRIASLLPTLLLVPILYGLVIVLHHGA